MEGVVRKTYGELEVSTTRRFTSIGKSLCYEWEVKGRRLTWTIGDTLSR